ncbi:MAG TPA: helix-turn-helix transcriptional regulator [Pyrinomonadaceae bacterium]|nr:helix-turn-helix transcriptional regulator [Pyrinomonadaceae bacterium]
MFPQTSPIRAQLESETYPLGEKTEHAMRGYTEALVVLSHSAVENRLYAAMRSAQKENGSRALTARRLKALTGIRSQSTIRRGLGGLLAKLSIERDQKPVGEPGASYVAFSPEQIIARRKERGINTYERGLAREGNHSFDRAISRVAENRFLSRREVQVALCCVEGLTNAEIGHRLEVSEQTVKFHLRHIFVKFGVKRRAELISKLLM